MYTLLSGLYKYMFQKDEYCILILGLDNAGKTVKISESKVITTLMSAIYIYMGVYVYLHICFFIIKINFHPVDTF